MGKGTNTLLGLAVGLALFFGVNIFANASLRSMRIDLTDGDLYTLSEGAKNVVRDLDEPLRVTLFYSEGLEADVPVFKDHFIRVREVLEEFELAASGDLELTIVDPEPFSEDEERAVEAGIFGQPIGRGTDKFYFGLAASNSVGEEEVMAFLDPSKEATLEYDLSRAFHTLANPDKPVVGIVTSLPMMGGAPNPMNPMGGAPRWLIVDHIESLFETRDLGTSFDAVPDDVDVLLVVHPRNLSDATLYALDQYVLGGGRAVVYVDPHCEADESGNDPTNPLASMGASRASGLEPLLSTWGVDVVENKVVGDREKALRVTMQGDAGPEQWQYVAWIQLDGDQLDDDDPLTSGLGNLIVPTPGALLPAEGATTTFQRLAWTTEDSMKIDVGQIQFVPDPKRLLNQFVAEHEELTIAARVSGPVSSAYPDGPPAAEEDAAAPATPHLAASTQDVTVVVVADVDNLVDRFWIQEDLLMGQISLGYRKTSNNGDLCFNALELLAGGNDLISIRARGRYSRPFDKVEEIRSEAEQRYLQEEEALQTELREAERRIQDLQREGGADTTLILSPEQQLEIDRAREKVVETKKELRRVQLALRQDIEALGTKIKWINIGAVPGLVVLAALSVWGLNSRRRRR